ncbi:AAA family ATPase [Yimella sp. cx-51]|uniref:AAA family ATPase n=1 Tax=Yimella sp. cx-51 TaxID=2770551 RepID=UPI00165E404D|nr:SMC family ATPase [Yimella sp. cx-51]MBC9957784.1 SMC family ATPase [Yimella sp. cx-51]QTH36873.1 SMC family ATPase [Yimella sp. cx-51]
MKLHHLQLRAFGPFGGDEQIDFDTLGASGLFLMHGPTGSGKTSVLDAICFALFASVPGGRTGQAERLVSDHAEAGTKPMVRLEFTLAGRRLRITRTPAHLAAKKRGSGTTRRQPSVLIEERLAGAWHALSNRADETADLLDDLLGMGLHQFTQVVLLPQGEFAAFLRAKADDRAALLQRLFDISRFSDLEAWLAQERRECVAAVAANDQAIQTAVVRVEESLVDHAAVIERWRAAEVTALPAQIAATETVVQQQLTEAMALADASAAAAEAAQTAHDHAVVVAQLQRQAGEARSVIKAWSEQQDEADATRSALDQHDRALRVVPLHRSATRAATRLEARRSELTALETGLLADHGEDVDTDELTRALARGRESLQLAGEAMREHRRSSTRRPGCDRDVAAAQPHRDALAHQMVDLDIRLTMLDDTIAAAQQVIDESAHCERQRELLDEWRTAERDRIGAESVRDETATQQSDARTRFTAAESTVLRLRTQRLAGMAAELAAGLDDDSPCPVCGSCEHPQPATLAERVTQEAVDAAEQAAATSRTQLDDASARFAAAQANVIAAQKRAEQISTQWEQLGGSTLDQASSPALRLEVEAAVRALQQARTTTRAARTERATIEPEGDALRSRLKGAEESLTEKRAALAALDRQIAEADDTRQRAWQTHLERCVCSASDHGVEQAISRHAALGDRLAELDRRRAAVAVLISELDEATTSLNRQVEDEGFDCLDDALAAVIPAAQAQQMRSQLAQAEAAVERARGVLAQSDVAAADALEPIDLPSSEARRREAMTAGRRARTALDDVRRAAHSLRRLDAEVTTLLQASAHDRDRLPALQRMADLAAGSGDNSLRMRLSAYVLAARLEEVTALANHQLSVMSAGRYQLAHTDALARGGARSGLSLQVRDSWTGTSRDTATLSGGETFMVSLALALGLGQAVLHDTGGRPLQTLLVDEGFGTLDDESLELVMHVLDELRSGGRTVGIVSHVGELRIRVPAQIQVRKTEQGSSVRVHVAA